LIRLPVLILLSSALPAGAATGPFFSMGNTDFVVTIAFLLFVGAIIYFKAPGFAAKLIDGRIDVIRNEIERAEALKAEAEDSLKAAKKENSASVRQCEQIVEQARENSLKQIEEAKSRISEATGRRIQAATEQIASAEQAALDSIRNRAIDLAIEVAEAEIATRMTAESRREMTARALQEIQTNIR